MCVCVREREREGGKLTNLKVEKGHIVPEVNVEIVLLYRQRAEEKDEVSVGIIKQARIKECVYIEDRYEKWQRG